MHCQPHTNSKTFLVFFVFLALLFFSGSISFAAPKTAFGSLMIKSSGENDRIFVDNQYKGNQSVILLKINAGEHVVKVKRGNDIIYHTVVMVDRNKKNKVNVNIPFEPSEPVKDAVGPPESRNQLLSVSSDPGNNNKERNPVWGILTDTPYNLKQGEGNFGAGTILYIPYLANIDYGITDRLQIGVDGWIFPVGIGAYLKYNLINEDSVWPQLTAGVSQYKRINTDKNNVAQKVFFSSSISDVSLILGKKTQDNLWLYCGGKSVVQLIGDPVIDRNDIVGAKIGMIFDIGESNNTNRRALFEVYYKWFTLSDTTLSGLAGGMSWEKDKDITTIGLLFPVLIDKNSVTVLSVPVPFKNFQWRF